MAEKSDKKKSEEKKPAVKMTKAEKEKAKKQQEMLINNYKGMRLSVFALSGFYTLGVIAVTAGLGYLLDQQFGTYPKLFIAGLLIGYPITLVTLRMKFKKYAEKKLKE